MSMTCLTPIYVRGRQLPCGKCGVCLKKRSLEWSFRLTQESENWNTTSFITLTYDDAYLPTSGVDKVEIQRFLKRLRKQGVQFKYYATSEYGPQGTHRPHYHILFFHDLMPEFFYEHVEKAWNKGIVTIGDFCEARIKYCANYHITKAWNPDHKNQNFVIMSKGLGANYLTSDRLDYYRKSGNMFSHDYNGQRVPLSRYYKDKIIFTSEQKARNREFVEKQSKVDSSSLYQLKKYMKKIDEYVKKKLKGRKLS